MDSTEAGTKYVSFVYAIERNGILYDDDCFVTLTSDGLDIVAKHQHQCDADTYRSLWHDKIGQLVYVYDTCRGRMFKHGVDLHPNIGKYRDVDLHIADKESLTISAGRQLGRYLYTGSGDIAQIAEYCSIAMMLYLRSGQTKYDLYHALNIEYLRTIHQLLDGIDVDFQQLLIGNLHSNDEFDFDPRFDLSPLCPTDLVKVAEEKAKRYPDAACHMVDDELIEILDDIDYPVDDDYIRSIKGQYAMVYAENYDTEFPGRFLTLGQLRNLSEEEEIFVDTMDRFPIYCVDLFDDILFSNTDEFSIVVDEVAEGMALFHKNGKTHQDYLHAFCAALDKYARNSVTQQLTKDELTIG